MNCKVCGEEIPTFLLRQDSFECPKCGRMYRRSAKPGQAPNRSRRTDDSASPKRNKQDDAASPKRNRQDESASPKRNVQRREKAPSGPREKPRWLLPAIAAVLIVALLGCSVWLIGKRGRSGYSAKIAGQAEMGEIGIKRTVSQTIEIPEQPNTNYLIATESNNVGIVCTIRKKTTNSFELYARNLYSKKRSPTITWVLIPY